MFVCIYFSLNGQQVPRIPDLPGLCTTGPHFLPVATAVVHLVRVRPLHSFRRFWPGPHDRWYCMDSQMATSMVLALVAPSVPAMHLQTLLALDKARIRTFCFVRGPWSLHPCPCFLACRHGTGPFSPCGPLASVPSFPAQWRFVLHANGLTSRH